MQSVDRSLRRSPAMRRRATKAGKGGRVGRATKWEPFRRKVEQGKNDQLSINIAQDERRTSREFGTIAKPTLNPLSLDCQTTKHKRRRTHHATGTYEPVISRLERKSAFIRDVKRCAHVQVDIDQTGAAVDRVAVRRCCNESGKNRVDVECDGAARRQRRGVGDAVT
jgi:hypothetical protein